MLVDVYPLVWPPFLVNCSGLRTLPELLAPILAFVSSDLGTPFPFAEPSVWLLPCVALASPPLFRICPASRLFRRQPALEASPAGPSLVCQIK